MPACYSGVMTVETKPANPEMIRVIFQCTKQWQEKLDEHILNQNEKTGVLRTRTGFLIEAATKLIEEERAPF